MKLAGGVPKFARFAKSGDEITDLATLNNTQSCTGYRIVMHTEAEKMACTWFGEIPSSCSLTVLLGPAWVLLGYALQTVVYELVPTR